MTINYYVTIILEYPIRYVALANIYLVALTICTAPKVSHCTPLERFRDRWLGLAKGAYGCLRVAGFIATLLIPRPKAKIKLQANAMVALRYRSHLHAKWHVT